VVGYLGQLHFGLVSCRELVPDLDNLAGYLVDELELLLKAAEQRVAEQRAAEPRTAEQPAAEHRAAG
jgi:hypothetical protein